jgi:hypothetical protein
MITEQDIVERLRNHVNHRNGPSLLNGAWQMMLDAAEEITKLRVERDAAARDLTVACQIIHDLTDGITGTLQSDAVEAAAREMQERCAGWHDAEAMICRDVAKANQGNEVGPVFHALVVDHEVAADAIRALPDDSSVVANGGKDQ